MTGKLQAIIFTVITILCSGYEVPIYAQGPPATNPGNWILIPSMSDEFNGSTLDTSKWRTIYPCVYTDSLRHGANGEGAFFRDENVSVSNGNLNLKCDINPDSLNFSYPCVHYSSYPFYSGGVTTHAVYEGPDLGIIGSYSYGYYEISAKLPGYYDSNNNPVGYGFWPAFFVAYQYVKNGCLIRDDEIDILEPSPAQFYDAETNVVGWHDDTGVCQNYKVGEDSSRSTSPLFAGYHKFAVETLPDKMVFYFDDQAFYSVDTLTSPSLAHSLNMTPYMVVAISLQTGGNDYASRPYHDTPFPQYMYVDYFRYYQLNPNYYQNTLSQNFPNPFSNSTEIDFSIATNSTNAFINVYNLLGMHVKAIKLQVKGQSKIILDHAQLASGVYSYNLVVDNKIIDTKKLIIF